MYILRRCWRAFKEDIFSQALAVLVILMVIGSFWLYTRLPTPPDNLGEREQYGCFQYGDQEYCEVWVQTHNGWALCYRTVPASIPVEDINCHE